MVESACPQRLAHHEAIRTVPEPATGVVPVIAPHPAALAVGDPVFDWRTLLDRVGGNVELGRSVLELFLEDTPAYALEVVASLRAGDWANVARQAHRLKGTSATVGADRLRALAVDIEERAARATVVDSAATEQQLLATLDEVLARMRDILVAITEAPP